MNTILLIIKREYLTRVRKKAFIIMTILGPLLFGLIMVVPIWLMSRDMDEKVIKVIDQSGYFAEKFTSASGIKFEYITTDLDSAKNEIGKNDLYGILYIPSITPEKPEGIIFFSEGSPGFEVIGSMEKTLSSEIENIRLLKSGIDPKLLNELKTHVSLTTINLAGGEEKEGNAMVSSIVGYLSSFMIYMFIFYYGIQIMRGVIEEKSNKIVEVIISSVKPFQLMMGKIIGVGAVGLTQFIVWSGLSTIIYSALLGFLGMGEVAAANPQMAGMAANDGGNATNQIIAAMQVIDFKLIIACFAFYFLSSYLLYGALFAAIGSAVDNDSDAQQFQLPVTIPLIFAIVTLGAVLKDPDGTLAFWMSIVPLTSPVVMMMRIPFGVPAWELALSMSLLVAGFLVATWFAGRVYRIGIIMHGTKPNWGTLVKWFLIKN